MSTIEANFRFPLTVSSTGLDEPSYSAHVRQMIEQLLFTAPGERVNRPDFGTGLLHLLFNPGDDTVAAAYQALTQSALERVLGQVISVEGVHAASEDSRLVITVQYVIRRHQTRHVERFVR